MKSKLKMSLTIWATINECLTFYLTKSKYYNKLVVGQMKDETSGVMMEEFAGLKPKMYMYLVDDNSEHKKAKGIKDKNVVVTIIHNKYKCFTKQMFEIFHE